MPVHYDPARIRKRFCPRGHDKHKVGVCRHQCAKCHGSQNREQKKKLRSDPEYRAKEAKRNSNGWQNPLNAIRDRKRKIRIRRERTLEQMQDLLAQLKEGEIND